MAKSPDWITIKADYITDSESSYKKMAQKYGLSETAVSHHACRDGWYAEKQEHLAELLKKTMDAHKEGNVERLKRLLNVTDVLVDKIEELITNVEVTQIQWAAQWIKSITSAIKDIKDIQQLKSQLDIDEQQARIEKLRKDVERHEGDSEQTIHIVMDGGADEYAQ